MGNMARPPTPKAILESRGSWRSKLKPDELKPKNSIPECPQFLHTTAKREWTRITKILKTLGIAATIDRAALAAYCQAWAEYVHLTDRLLREGPVLENIQGNKVRNPTEAARNQAEDRMLKWADRFGMSPVARARLGLVGHDESDDDDERRFLGKVGP